MYDVIMTSSNLDFDENVFFLVFNAARMGQWQLHADWFFYDINMSGYNRFSEPIWNRINKFTDGPLNSGDR